MDVGNLWHRRVYVSRHRDVEGHVDSIGRDPPYFHEGSAATLEAVVEHYDKVRKLR